jgi:hypothetical protein
MAEETHLLEAEFVQQLCQAVECLFEVPALAAVEDCGNDDADAVAQLIGEWKVGTRLHREPMQQKESGPLTDRQVGHRARGPDERRASPFCCGRIHGSFTALGPAD